MANISPVDRKRIEPYLQMEGGYVLDFSNHTFAQFVAESVNMNIDDAKYCQEGTSKGKRLRAFFKLESATVVAKLLEDLVIYRRAYLDEIHNRVLTEAEEASFKICQKVIQELKSDVSYIEWNHPNSDNDEDFEKLSKNIQYLISNNQPDVGIDRLHTFTVKFFRKLCKAKGIETDGKPLHSIFGEYVKYLEQKEHIHSKMTIRILKSSISILEAFNDVRNNQSLAHDNQLLSYDECVLIFKNVSALINYVKTIEDVISKLENPPKPPEPIKPPMTMDDLPF